MSGPATSGHPGQGLDWGLALRFTDRMVGRIVRAGQCRAAPRFFRSPPREPTAVKASKKPMIAAECDRTIDIYTKAAEIFHEQGFDATSMSNIAAAVDLTKAGLYYYIESKEDLLFAIMNYAMERLETMVIEPSREIADPEQRLRSIITRHGRLLTEGNKAITILTDEIEGLKPKHRKQILDRKRVYFEFVRGTLDALQGRRQAARRQYDRGHVQPVRHAALAAALVPRRRAG